MPTPNPMTSPPAVAAFRQKLAASVETALGQAVDEGYRLLVDQSPVSTGRFKAGWKKEIAPKTAMTRGSGLPTGDLARICNEVPYGPFLENGDAARAGAGLVEKTAICLGNLLDDLLAAGL